MQRVIEPELDIHIQLEQALARIAELEKELFVLRGKGASYFLYPTAHPSTSVTINGIAVGSGGIDTTGTYAGIVRSTEPLLKGSKP